MSNKRETDRSEQRELFETPIGLSIAKLAELAAWGEGRAPRPRWFRQSRPGARESLETSRHNRAPSAMESDGE